MRFWFDFENNFLNNCQDASHHVDCFTSCFIGYSDLTQTGFFLINLKNLFTLSMLYLKFKTHFSFMYLTPAPLLHYKDVNV